MAIIIFTQEASSKRTITFDFSDALAANEVITSQSAVAKVHDGLAGTGAVGTISDLARDDTNKKVSLAYLQSVRGLYEIEVTATTAAQVVKQTVMVEVE